MKQKKTAAFYVGYFVGIVLIACVTAVLIAGTIAAVRAIL